MKKNCFIILIGWVLISCSNGKIEKRDPINSVAGVGYGERIDDNAKSVFLVNKSGSKQITFTVKCSERRPELDEPIKTSTFTVTLNPGDESFLGVTNVYYTGSSDSYYAGTNIHRLSDWEIVGELKEN